MVIGGDGMPSDIVSLDSLGSLITIGGRLEISRNQFLIDLFGLDSLTSVGGGVIIVYNEYLTSLSALHNLVDIGGDLRLEYNFALTDLFGLENINSESIDNLIIYNNSYLTDCQALSLCNYLSNPNGYVRIAFNSSGCFNPPEMAYECGITLPCLPYGNYYFYYQNQIDSFISDYPICTNLNGEVRVGQWVSDLDGLSNVQSINGSLYIQYCHVLTDLLGLENLSYIEDSLRIFDNEYLLDLNGLNGLQTVGGGVEISHNDALASLIGIDSLTLIGGNLSINENHYLSTLDGIDNIEPGTIENLTIVDNWFLTKCNVQSICDYLVSPNGTIEISDNEPGCNSQAEVEEACTVGVSEPPDVKELSTYPNPFTTSTTIQYELTKPSRVQLTIYNSIGEAILLADEGTLPPGKHTFTWTPERLSEGMYYAVLRNEDGVSVIKLIKQ